VNINIKYKQLKKIVINKYFKLPDYYREIEKKIRVSWDQKFQLAIR
jgi:hypothetical protein